MKAKAKAIVITIFVLAMFVAGICAVHEAHKEQTYGVDAMVTAIDDTIHVVDSDGMAYQFYGEGYQVNQTVRLIMSNNCSPDRYDDKVIGAVTL